MMDLEWKVKWVDALRSGKYEQGRFSLRTVDDMFCCLGVLCDLVDPGDWRMDGSSAIDGIYTHGGGCHSGVPSRSVTEQVELNRVALDDLTNMNDRGRTFSEIADYIEENL